MQATDTFPLPIADDSRLLTGLRAREASGFTEVYATYAARLFDYAAWMIGDTVEAEDAVLNALLVAVDRADKLTSVDRFGVWLYALTRNECLRQRRRSTQALALHDDAAPARNTNTLDNRRGGPPWAWSAAATLEPRAREVLDLALRHALTTAQLAQVLGISVRRASALTATAKTSFQRTVAEVRAADPTSGVCGELRALLLGREGPLPPAIKDMVEIHRAICAACGAAGRGEAHATQVFATLPAMQLPPALHGLALRAATVPSRVSARGAMAEPFFRSGFPVPLDRVRSRFGPVAKAALAGAAAVAVLAGVGGFVLWPALEDPVPPKRVVATASKSGAGSSPSSPVSEVTVTISPSWRPITPSPTPTLTPPSASPTARPSPTRTRSASPPPPSDDGRGTGRPAQVDALLADTTLGCPKTWRAQVTVFVRFNVARTVTFFWGTSGNPNRPLAMRRVNDSLYQVDATGLPLNDPVFWKVSATTVDGKNTTTPVNMTRHVSIC